jgi:large subunit ribosomal protein L35
MKTTPNIPFEQLPYQCFQEARAFLQEDRAEKLAAIQLARTRLARTADQVAVDARTQRHKDDRMISLRDHLEELKILADINDPLVKKKFEDGQGMCRCISRSSLLQIGVLIIYRRFDETNLSPFGRQEMAQL